MGLEGEGLPLKVAKHLNMPEEKVLIPYHFALIKESTENAKAQTALGVLALYHYAGPTEKVVETCSALANIFEDIKEQKLKYRPLIGFEVVSGVKMN